MGGGLGVVVGPVLPMMVSAGNDQSQPKPAFHSPRIEPAKDELGA